MTLYSVYNNREIVDSLTDPLVKPTDKKREFRRRKEVAGKDILKKQFAFRDERASGKPVAGWR